MDQGNEARVAKNALNTCFTAGICFMHALTETLEKGIHADPCKGMTNSRQSGRRGTLMKSIGFLLSCASALLLSFALPTAPALGAQDTIPAGTTITMQNWRKYQQFMTPGMIDFFEGKHFWKMPSDIQIDVGSTVIHPLPAGYRAATEKYSNQVRLVQLPDGGLNLVNYTAGEPFPNLQAPHKGWKILANMWYRYLPHIFVATKNNLSAFCSQDRFHGISCMRQLIVYRQLKHNTDPGVPQTDKDAGAVDFTEWGMVLQPENLKYTAFLTIGYTDLTRPQDVYIFKPDLRRSLRLATSARCSPMFNSDLTQDDTRFGFDGNITKFQAKFLGEKKILALTDYKVPAKFTDDWVMPLGWPKPSWGKWELRDVYAIEVKRIASANQGYCYGKRVMYVDKQFYAPLWEELYDAHMRLWKIVNLSPRAAEVPGVGIVNGSGSTTEEWWDIQNNHVSYAFFIPDQSGRDVLADGQVPSKYNNVAKYSTPGGLSEILR
jgi:Protein of unknown function (DUF1329)